MNWTTSVWFVVGVLLGIMVGAMVWWRRQKPALQSEQRIVDEAAYQAQIEQLEGALSKAEKLVHDKAHRLHSAESQRSALHAQFEVTHARMSQFRDLLGEATEKLKLEHNARRTAEKQVRGLDSLVQAVQAQLVRLENERQHSAEPTEDDKIHFPQTSQAIPQLDEKQHSWQQRAWLLQASVQSLQHANDELARKLAMTENKLVNRTYELRSAEAKIRSSKFATNNTY